jgi:hypothetical protein
MFTLRKQEKRRRQFKAALVAAGIPLSVWAETQGVTHTHLNYVLRGERKSPRLEAAIGAVIAKRVK